MAEVQKTTQTSGEMTQRFIEFVMMQAQQAALFLGRFPHPQSGKREANLDVARMLIDQLEMIREKTRGNLSHEESEILGGILSDLQMGFVQAMAGQKSEASAPPPQAGAEPPAASETTPAAQDEEAESKKRFTKSYGP